MKLHLEVTPVSRRPVSRKAARAAGGLWEGRRTGPQGDTDVLEKARIQVLTRPQGEDSQGSGHGTVGSSPGTRPVCPATQTGGG